MPCLSRDIPLGWRVAVDPCTVPRDQLAATEGVLASSVYPTVCVEGWRVEESGPHFPRHCGEVGISMSGAQPLPFPCPEG